MYKAILFDFFGVFCAPIATNWFKKAVPSYDEAQLKAWQALCTQGDLGKLSRADFNAEVSKLTGVPVPEVVRGIEAETVINDSLVAYTQKLKTRGYRIACLSNGSSEWTLQVINDHGLRDLFDEVVLSGDLGIVKPDPKIYTYTLQKLDITAAEAIFVDDRQANVDAGEACGIRSLLFTDTPAFVTALENVLKKGRTAMTKIVVTQPMEFREEHIARLNALGDVTYYDTFTADGEAWLKRCEGADIICTGKFGFKEKWAELRDVFVSIPSVGVGFLDPNVLKANGVVVSNSPGCNRHAVSEWIVGMMLVIFRRLNDLISVDDLPADHPPEPTRGLAYKKVVILGKGNIGSRVGAVCEALEMQVAYFTRRDNLLDCVKGADVVVDTLSLNPSTVGLLGKEFFAALKPGAVFITATSEEIRDTDAMLRALDEGKLAWVASDAGSILMGNTADPLYQKLLAHPKVLVTPHLSYNTDVTHQISNDMMIDNVEAWLAGKPIHMVGRA